MRALQGRLPQPQPRGLQVRGARPWWGWGARDGTGARLTPSSHPIQTLRLRPRWQRGHLRPQHGTLRLQGEGGGAPLQQVSTLVPGWEWDRGPFPGWGRRWGLGSVQSRHLCCCGASLLPQPLNTAPCGGICSGNLVGSLLMEAGGASLGTTGTGPRCHCGPLPLPCVLSPYPGASPAGLTSSPTTLPAAPVASAMATRLSARQRPATR